MRRRFRRSAARWSYADAGLLQINQGSTSATAHIWILPPARVAYMLSQRGRGNSLIFAGCHLWLDFLWGMHSTNVLPDVDLGVIKTTISDPTSFAPDLSLVEAQWDQPSTPATLTSWDEDDDSGIDSWLWQHHIKGSSPPNAVVRDTSALKGNQFVNVPDASTDNIGIVCRKFMVSQEWQPDVVIRSKRRLQKDEGILLYMNLPTGIPAASMNIELDVHLRTLTK